MARERKLVRKASKGLDRVLSMLKAPIESAQEAAPKPKPVVKAKAKAIKAKEEKVCRDMGLGGDVPTHPGVLRPVTGTISS